MVAISYEKYKKQNPATKKTPNDPMFEKNDHFSIFQKTPKAEIVHSKDMVHRPSPVDAEQRSYEKAVDTLKGKYPKREPLSVWKVKKPNGKHFYSVRDGNTTYQMLRKQGWDTFPVHVEKEIDEKDLTPVSEHKRKS
jgi:hypothetical protein